MQQEHLGSDAAPKNLPQPNTERSSLAFGQLKELRKPVALKVVAVQVLVEQQSVAGRQEKEKQLLESKNGSS